MSVQCLNHAYFLIPLYLLTTTKIQQLYSSVFFKFFSVTYVPSILIVLVIRMIEFH